MFSVLKLDEANNSLICMEPAIVADDADVVEAEVPCSDLAVVAVLVEGCGHGSEED